MDAIPGVIVFMLGQVVVEGLVNGFDGWLDRMTNDICYTFCCFLYILEIERLFIAVKKVSFGEVLKAVCRE